MCFNYILQNDEILSLGSWGVRFFGSGPKVKNQKLSCEDILIKKGIWLRRAKVQKSLKLTYMAPEIDFCGDLMVVLRRGCEWFGGVRLRIFDYEE